MIKIEVVNIPAYTREVRQMKLNYSFLPDAYERIIIMTESLDEILADKLIAFVNCRTYIRHRDIWDMQWLKQKGTTTNISFISSKLADYQVENYQKHLRERVQMLDTIILGSDFKNQMRRFLPQTLQESTLLNAKFLQLLIRDTKETLESCGDAL